jgi:ubiquitin-conjugating enzyme E2 variant
VTRAVSRAAPRRHLHRLADVAALTVFAWLFCTLSWRIVAAAPPRDLAWVLPLSLAAGYLCADLCSGVVHWVADTWFEEDAPLLGPLLIRPFREHHRDPGAIARHGLLEVSGNNALVCLPILAALWWGPAPDADALAVVGLQSVLLATTLGVLVTNLFHKWAHADRIPRCAAWLQRRGLILSVERHAAHHLDLDRCYCVTSGWWNAPLDALGVFPALERLLRSGARRREGGLLRGALRPDARPLPSPPGESDRARFRATTRRAGLTRDPNP